MSADAYSFPLAWRWTQPTHNVLPPEAMARITPIEDASFITQPPSPGQLDAAKFNDVQTASADIGSEQGTQWLRSLPVALSEPVIVRWDQSTAVRTTWKIFTRYWDDFCYPNSDDVDVWPESRAWLLLYQHWEQFEWGRPRQGC